MWARAQEPGPDRDRATPAAPAPERVRDPANRRYYRLALTPAGAGAAARIGGHVSAQHQYLFAELTDEERNGLLTGMSGLARVMEQHHDQHHIRH